MASTIPRGVHWIKSAVAAFETERNAVTLVGGTVVRYAQLVVCPGLKLDWHAIEGLSETLGRNGVTSNYRYRIYLWRQGRPQFSILVDGTRPSRLARHLKEHILPPLYWRGKLKGHEWMAKPELVAQS